jgi:S1-C subfamily serine protease
VLVAGAATAASVTGLALVGVHLSSGGSTPALTTGFHTASVKASDPSISTPERTATSVAVGASIMALVSRVAPALVSIRAHAAGGDRRGTGIVYASDGIVVTTDHLVDGASSISATTSAGQEEAAALVGEDRSTDVAVVRIPGHDLTVAPFSASSTTPFDGSLTMAVLTDETSGTDPVVYLGTVRGVDEQVATPDGPPLLDMIETDAPVSGDVAGGALLDSRGSVIGITSAVTGAGQSKRCLATPAHLLLGSVRQLLTTGQVAHSWLGIEGRPVDTPSSPPPRSSSGVQVVSVATASPAASSGIEVGDTISSVDNRPVSSMLDVEGDLHEHSPGDQVTVGVLRNSQPLIMEAKLSAAPRP